MLVPLYDDDSTLKGVGYLTIILIVVNIAVFLIQVDYWSYAYGMIPYEIIHGVDWLESVRLQIGSDLYTIPQYEGPSPIYLTLVTSMFLHGDWIHLLSNMLYLLIFGDNVELRLGPLRFIWFYLLCGIGAAMSQALTDPVSFLPMIGASGAISGVLGAYLILFPTNRVRALVFYFPVYVPAVVAIGLWIVLQFLSGWSEAGAEEVGGVAYAAHIGGFFVGVILGIGYRLFLPIGQTRAVEVAKKRKPEDFSSGLP